MIELFISVKLQTILIDLREQSSYSSIPRLKAQYIAIHQICEVPTCNKQAVDIHHQKGRENDLLLDTNYWMAICRDHHIYYTEHSKEAIEEGVSYKRN